MNTRIVSFLKPPTKIFVYCKLLSFLNNKSGLQYWSETLNSIQQKSIEFIQVQTP